MEWSDESYETLLDIRACVDTNSNGNSNLPSISHLDSAISVFDESNPTNVVDFSEWADDVKNVIDKTDCSCIRDPLQAISNNQRVIESDPQYSQLLYTTLTLTLHLKTLETSMRCESICTKISKSVATISDDKSTSQNHLATAIEQVHGLITRMLPADEVLRIADEITYIHPDEDKQELKEHVDSLLEEEDTNRLRKLASSVNRTHRGSWKHEDLMSFDPKSFEHLLADLWSDMGYETMVVADRSAKQGGDQGVDVVATRSDEEVLIQAKRHANQVGVKMVREFIGTYPQWEPDKLYFVTTASISEPARREANRVDELFVLEDEILVQALTKSNLHPPIQYND